MDWTLLCRWEYLDWMLLVCDWKWDSVRDWVWVRRVVREVSRGVMGEGWEAGEGRVGFLEVGRGSGSC
jgi:hypothetical protein